MSALTAPVARAKRTRAFHTRSSKGCGVCRIRRVRCDFAEPSCRRCTSTGRACDGYRNGSSSGQSPPPTAGVAALLSGADLEAIDFFRRRTGARLCGSFEGEFWDSTVPQMSHREPAVLNIVAALASLDRSARYSNNQDAGAEASRRYSRTLTMLNAHLEERRWRNFEVTVLCSVLCAAFEWLRGNHDAARTHLNGTHSMLTHWLSPDAAEAGNKSSSSRRKRRRNTAAGATMDTRATSHSSPAGHLIATRIWPVYARMGFTMAALSIGHPLPLFLGKPPSDLVADAEISSSSFEDAWRALVGVLGNALFGHHHYHHQNGGSSIPTPNMPVLSGVPTMGRRPEEMTLFRIARCVDRIAPVLGAGCRVMSRYEPQHPQQIQRETAGAASDVVVDDLAAASSSWRLVSRAWLEMARIVADVTTTTTNQDTRPHPKDAEREMAFDSHTLRFSEVLDCFQAAADSDAAVAADEDCESQPQQQQQPPRDTAVVVSTMKPLAYLVAIKCRYPVVRRRAIALLHAAAANNKWRDHGTTATWDNTGAEEAAVVARAVVEFEESCAGGGVGVVVRRPGDVPAAARVAALSLERTDVRRRVMHLWLRRQGSDDGESLTVGWS